MWLVITYFADPCLKSIFVVWWSCFISRRKAVQMTFWNFGNTTFCWCCLWMRWGDGEARQREGFLFPARGTGHTERDYPPRLREKVIWFDDIPNRKSGMKTVCGTRFPCPRWSSPAPGRIQVHRQVRSPGLNRRAHWAVSASVIPTIPIPELDTIQCMKNSTIMNQNKRLLSRMLFF